MNQPFASLPTTLLARDAQYCRPKHLFPENLNLHSAARLVMTDFRHIPAVTISPSASIIKAHQKMLMHHLRLLFVTDKNHTVLGLITATDMLGEKPLLFMRDANRAFHEIQVHDIMTPASQLEVMQMVDVAKARVGDIIVNLEQSGRQHALVVDINEETLRESIRGIFSSAHIGRLLGINIEPSEKASTFAELEKVIAAG